MRFSWFLFLILLAAVAVFSVQNAAPITVKFLGWESTLSAALVIQLTALASAFVGLALGLCSRPRRHSDDEETDSDPKWPR